MRPLGDLVQQLHQPVAAVLADHPTVEVNVVGGMLAKHAQALVGAAAVEALRSVRADVLVLGVCSLHPEIGITVLDVEESYVKRAMIANAAEVVLAGFTGKVTVTPEAVVIQGRPGSSASLLEQFLTFLRKFSGLGEPKALGPGPG